MAIDEKYLDDLLKSITENEDEPRTMDDAMREMASLSEAEVDGANENWANDLDDFFSQPQDLGYEDSVALDDFAEEVLPEMTPDLEENVNLEEMELLKEIAEAGFDYEHASLDSPSEDNGTDDETEDEVDADVDISEMMDSLGVGNDDLDEINGLLSNVDESASVDEDILALLEGMEGSEEIEDAEDPFNLFDEEILEAVKEQEPFNDQVQIQEEEPEPETEVKEKKAKKSKKEKPEKAPKSEKKFRLKGRKKRAAEDVDPAEESAENEEIAASPMEVAVEEVEPGIAAYEESEEIANIRTKDEVKEKKVKKEKKPGFLAGFFAALFQEEEDEDTAAEENKKLLKEIGDEDKKGKKGKKKKGSADDSAKADKKQKKPKKEKAPKKPKEKKPKEKKPAEDTKERSKPLGKKTWFVIIAFCGTLLASIVLLSVFLPEYADKKAAQNAFYSGDYETAYTLLYGKKLSDDDMLMFHKAETIRTMERRLESYNNKLALNQELEAVDTLLKAVSCYQLLTEADEYGVRSEVDAVYQQIVSLLENNYGITAQEAMEVISYDEQAYTRRLHTAVYGTDFTDPDDEADEASDQSEDAVPEVLPAQDVLPEEEEFMDN